MSVGVSCLNISFLLFYVVLAVDSCSGMILILFVFICFQLYSSDDLDNEVDEILQDFEHKVNRTILHTALFY